MDDNFLTVRLSKDDVRTIERLKAATGLTKSEIVKKAIRSLAAPSDNPVVGSGLFDLGAGRFGAYGNSRRQSTDIKRIARARARAGRIGR